MTYNAYVYAYTYNIISSVTQLDVIEWLSFSKYTQKWSTEIEGFREDDPAVADAPGCQSDKTQRSQRRQSCQQHDPCARVYCNKTDATNKCVINAQILECCNRYRYRSNKRYTTTYPTSKHMLNFLNRYRILYGQVRSGQDGAVTRHAAPCSRIFWSYWRNMSVSGTHINLKYIWVYGLPMWYIIWGWWFVFGDKIVDWIILTSTKRKYSIPCVQSTVCH